MKPIEVGSLTEEELTQLDKLYRQTKNVRVRNRAQIILLGAEDKMTAPEIAKIVRQDEQTVRRWIKRFKNVVLKLPSSFSISLTNIRTKPFMLLGITSSPINMMKWKLSFAQRLVVWC